ncbi:pro-resilin-like [Diprion similis]|uniref:pro-resilin-like n=1 Tax=Diprion similis TaxID=362088 RepID=UPI001EF93A19|nr:pro-resilin-like [Diprion similis]
MHKIFFAVLATLVSAQAGVPRDYQTAPRNYLGPEMPEPSSVYLPPMIGEMQDESMGEDQERTSYSAMEPKNVYLPAPEHRYLPVSNSAQTSGDSWASSGSRASSKWGKDSFSISPSMGMWDSNQYDGRSASQVNFRGYQESYETTEPAKYQFEYAVKDDESGNEYQQKEGRDGELTWGVYSVLLPDGRKQIVEYEADQDGFKPRISYEETRQRSPQGPY